MALTGYNEISIRSKIQTALKKKQFVNFAYRAANTRFVFAVNELLRDFDEHQVTKELKKDPSINGSALISHGNLFSFIGFDENDNPAQELRLFLQNNTRLSKENVEISTTRDKIFYTFKVKYPSKTEINREFPTPDKWSSKSWIEIIEDGIGNAAYFIFNKTGLFKKLGSRSGYGLQRDDRKPRESGGSFTPIKYVSEIIDNFKEKFRKTG